MTELRGGPLTRPLSYEAAMRILLEGTCGVNGSVVHRAVGVHHVSVHNFVRGGTAQPETLERLGMFLWRQLNAHLLMSDEDRQAP